MLPGRGAVWLAHQYGVLGVGGSNPLVPTIIQKLLIKNIFHRNLLCKNKKAKY